MKCWGLIPVKTHRNPRGTSQIETIEVQHLVAQSLFLDVVDEVEASSIQYALTAIEVCEDSVPTFLDNGP